MKLSHVTLAATGISTLTLIPFLSWRNLIFKGKQFALRDRLQKADAIVVLAGTRGNNKYLEGKICTAVELYKKGWAPEIIFSGRFSVKVTDTPQLIPLADIQNAADNGRIQTKDIEPAAATWDEGLGAVYMREQAIKLGVPETAILAEANSLHTRENAENVLHLLEKNQMHRIILVTSPFHQLRTYLTFAKVLQPHNIEIINYYANTGEWHPLTWFLSAEHRRLVESETERIKKYKEKGDLL